MKKIISIVRELAYFFMALLFPAAALAQPGGAEGGFGLKETAEKAGLPGARTGTTLPAIVGTIISYALGIMGTILVVLILYGGVRWMTAAGNEEQVTEAKNIIKNATIGLIIIVLAYGIAQFVVDALNKAAEGG